VLSLRRAKPDAKRRAAIRGALALAIAACFGCTASADGGVHVVLTLDRAAFPDDGSFSFDHVEVTATSKDGSKRAAACFFYSEEAEKEIPLTTTTPSACADEHTAAWIAPPTLSGWALETTPRTVNFVFPSGTDLDIDAVAGLGGRLHVGIAHATATADASYPVVPLSLGLAAPSISTDCHASLASVTEGFSKFVEAQPDLCLSDPFRGTREHFCKTDLDAWRRLPDLPEGHAPTMTCAGTASRIDDAPIDPCPGDDPSLVWRAPIPKEITNGCMNVLVTGHFARCAARLPDGTCSALSTDCTPPLTELAILEKGKTPTSVSFSCLPPFAEPVTFLIRLDRPAPLSAAQDVAIFYHPPVGGVGASCFFDLYSLGFQPIECGP
jgi:hypothetical protein